MFVKYTTIVQIDWNSVPVTSRSAESEKLSHGIFDLRFLLMLPKIHEYTKTVFFFYGNCI